jgi:nucleotide-binding universal stress UspA family protein
VADGPTLICYDGSEWGRRAISAAAELLSGRPAVVLEVTQPPALAEWEAAFVSTAAPGNLDRRLMDVRRLAHRGVQLARGSGLDASALVAVAGNVWDGIVGVADDVDASVIVVGSPTLGGRHPRDLGGRPLLVVPGR